MQSQCLDLLDVEDGEMDQDLRKSLREMADAIAGLAAAQARNSPMIASPPDVIRRLPVWATILGILVSVLAVLGSGWAILQYTISSEISKAFIEPNLAATRLAKDVETLRRDVNALQTQSSVDKIQHAAVNPDGKESAIDAKKGVEYARENSLQLPAKLIENIGQKYLRASDKTPIAWDTALSFINYKSFLNGLSANLPTPSGPDFVTRYRTQVPGGMPPPVQHVYGSAPPESEALMDFIGENENKSLAQGRADIFLDGGNETLDGMQFRNVIFRNVNVYYYGGPVVMKNVYFINCTFYIQKSSKAQDLAIALLDSTPSTTFSGL